jgi:hypothetical protein
LNLGGGFVPDRFKLIKSPRLVALEGGTHPSYNGQNWDAYVSFHPGFFYCSVQVNYQIGLRALYDRMPSWTAAWSSMWATRTSGGPLDPDVGDIRSVGLFDMYKSQTYAAMWRMAKAKVEEHFEGNAGVGHDLLKALITYLLVCCSINVPNDVDFIKNNFPQLPKTSPASIARAIEALDPNMVPVSQALARPDNPDVNFLQELSLNTLRDLTKMVGNPGYLPTTAPYVIPPNAGPLPGPQTGYAKFSSFDGNLVSGPAPPNFKNTFYGTFDSNHVLDNANKHGFLAGAPFYCAWASGVNSSIPAIQVPQLNDVIMTLESRYDRSLLNIGFDPYIQDFLFNRSYLSLVRIMLGQAVRDGLQVQVGADFPDNGLQQQNFPNDQRH